MTCTEAGLARFYEWNINFPGSVMSAVRAGATGSASAESLRRALAEPVAHSVVARAIPPKLPMSMRRQVLGFSTLAIVVGLLTACFAPGGWFSDWSPNWHYTGGFGGEFNSFLTTIGFAKQTVIPFIGLVSLMLGSIGLVLGFVIRPSRAKTATNESED